MALERGSTKRTGKSLKKINFVKLCRGRELLRMQSTEAKFRKFMSLAVPNISFLFHYMFSNCDSILQRAGTFIGKIPGSNLSY
jgi:hypothetical protein